MRYASVCSGVEAASLAWIPLGWEAVWFSEIEPFPSAVLKERFPDVPNLGDMTKIDGRLYRGAVDLLVGGTPCQGFSVAGKREGLQDPRSNLCLAYCRLLETMRPDGSYGKMCRGYLAPTEETISNNSSERLMKSGIAVRGEFWTLNMSEWTDSLVPFLKEDAVCSLSDILEVGNIPQKYYLSPTACKGILRRAEKRGKVLPKMLKIALEQQAQREE